MHDDAVILIPARSGSRAVPDKNIKLLGGKPLIAYTIRAAKLAVGVDRVVVSTDSEKYAAIAREYGAETPFLRPAEFAGDNNGDYDVVKHLLDWMQQKERNCPELVVYLRPTTPFRDPVYIGQALGRIRADATATALRAAHEMDQSSYKTHEIDGGYLKCICSGSFDVDAANQPRQSYPPTYDPNGYVDVFRTSFMLRTGKLLGNRVIALVTPPTPEVDTVEDFEYLQYCVAKRPTLATSLFQ